MGSRFRRYTCPSCRGTGVLERPHPVPDEVRGKECFILHRQFGIVKRCLRADAGMSQQCDWIPPDGSSVPHVRPLFDENKRLVPRDDGNDGYGQCPIAMREILDRRADPVIAAQAALRRRGGDPMDALKLEEKADG